MTVGVYFKKHVGEPVRSRRNYKHEQMSLVLHMESALAF